VPDALRFTSAEGLSAAELGALLVAAFAGYRYPPAPDPAASMAERLETEDLDASASVMALDDAGQRVGLSLLAVRGADSWCGGFGLVPGVRGRGHAVEMMREQARRAAAAGAARLRLEVLEGNVPALRAYARAGFRRVRDVGLWRHDGRPRRRSTAAVPTVDAGAAAEALARLARVRHTWQREPATLRRLAGRPGAAGAVWEHAAALWRSAPWGGTQLLGVAAAAPDDAGSALAALVGGLPAPVVLFNEPGGTSVDAALGETGFFRYDRQHELALEPLAPAGEG
jgi:RimJ/RimL family protein N-acetyltransferase